MDLKLFLLYELNYIYAMPVIWTLKVHEFEWKTFIL